MKDYSNITQVRISDSEAETNELLAGEWVLMDVGNQQGKTVFVLGLPYTLDLEAFCNIGKSISGHAHDY